MESAQKKLQSAINGLDIEVASKNNIKRSMSKLNTSLYKQITLSEQYASTFVTVANTLVDSDNKSGNKSQSIFEKVKNYIEDTTKTIKDYLSKNKIAKYATVAGLFMVAPSILCWSSTIAVLEKIGEWVKGWGIVAHAEDNPEATNTGATNDTSNSNNNSSSETSANNNSTIKDEQTNHSANSYDTNYVSVSTKSYQGSSKDMNAGGYSNYKVINGFDEKYVLNQYDYDLQQSDGSNGGCTSTSDAMVGSFKNNQYYNPEDDWPGPGKGGARWTHTKAIEGSKNWTTSRRYTEMYNQINQGNAVVIRVSGHSMVAIGVQNGCDPNNMSASDVLIANPGTGKISTLQEYLNKSGRKIDNSWSLRIAK